MLSCVLHVSCSYSWCEITCGNMALIRSTAALPFAALPPAALRVIHHGNTTYPVDDYSVGDYGLRMIRLNPASSDPLQVHEVSVDDERSKVYVSVLTTSELYELDLLPSSGELSPSVQRFTFNTPDSGLHNIAPSSCHPGCLWVATQYDNMVHLVDPAKGYAPSRLSVRVPRLLHNGTAWHLRLSEPHSVREAADCSIWVALKGATRNVPAGEEDVGYTEVYNAMTVLDPSLPRNHSDGHAIWHLHPSRYNATVFPGLGGALHAAMPTPVMSAQDGQGNTFHAQVRPAGGCLRLAPTPIASSSTLTTLATRAVPCRTARRSSCASPRAEASRRYHCTSGSSRAGRASWRRRTGLCGSARSRATTACCCASVRARWCPSPSSSSRRSVVAGPSTSPSPQSSSTAPSATSCTCSPRRCCSRT